jgi:hypothetical protein
MKSMKAVLCYSFVGMMAFAAGNAGAISTLVPTYVNVSGTATTEQESNPSPGVYKGKLVKDSIKTKDILVLLANATGKSWISNKNSMLVFIPDAYNSDASAEETTNIYGIFYVTNKTTHDGLQLDGYDNTDNYYSYIEFDYLGNEYYLGFYESDTYDTYIGENYADNYTENDNNGKSASKELGSDAIFYVHSNPYMYDYATWGSTRLFANNYAIVIRGPVEINSSQDTKKMKISGNLNGASDGIWYDSDASKYSYPVIKGKVSFNGSAAFSAP